MGSSTSTKNLAEPPDKPVVQHDTKVQSSTDEMQQALANTTPLPTPSSHPQTYPPTSIYNYPPYIPQYIHHHSPPNTYPHPQPMIDKNLYEMQQKYSKLQHNFNKLHSDFVHHQQQHTILHQIPFHWSHGGNEVYVAYSGDNWSQKYQMQRNATGFSLIMEIPAGIYHYKYIVDNEWHCAPDQPHVKDSTGAYSNLLQIPTAVPEVKHSIPHQEISTVVQKEEKPLNEEIEIQTNGYTQNIPLNYERSILRNNSLNKKMMQCPPHLQHVILNHKRRKNKKMKNESELFCYHSQMLEKPMRVSLNHLYVSENREEEIVTLGITERYRDKYYTTVYYKPIESTSFIENRA